jgi:hypothetical protein
MQSAVGIPFAGDLARAISGQAQKYLRGLDVGLRAPRGVASITLLLVMIAAMAAFIWTPQPRVIEGMTIATPASVAEAGATQAEPQAVAVPRESVKIIGGTPRSDNCADQVWPYIEYRCLAVAAAEKPQTVAVSTAVSPSGRAVAQLETAGAARADDARPEPPAFARPSIAIARLTLPPPRDAAIPYGGARVGAGEIGQSGWDRRTDGSAYPAAELPTFGKARQRAGRRAHRSRYGRGWGRRQPFGFLF